MVTDVVGGLRLAFRRSLLLLLGFTLFLSGFLLGLLHGGGLCLGVVSVLKERRCALTCLRSLFRKFLLFFDLGGCLLGRACILIFCFDSLNELDKVGHVLLPEHLVVDRDSHQTRRAGDLVQACKVAPVIERNFQMEDVLHESGRHQRILMLLLEDTFTAELRLEVQNYDRLVIASHLDEEVVELWDRHDLLVLSTSLAQRESLLKGGNGVTGLPLFWRLLLCSRRLVVLLLSRFGNFRLLSHRVDSNLVKIRAEKIDELLLLLEIVRDALCSQLPLLLVCRANAAGGHLIREHKGDQAKHDGLHGPARIPRLRVIIAEASADWIVDLEPALGSEELDPRWFERVVSGEEQSAPIESVLVWTLLEPED